MKKKTTSTMKLNKLTLNRIRELTEETNSKSMGNFIENILLDYEMNKEFYFEYLELRKRISKMIDECKEIDLMLVEYKNKLIYKKGE